MNPRVREAAAIAALVLAFAYLAAGALWAWTALIRWID